MTGGDKAWDWIKIGNKNNISKSGPGSEAETWDSGEMMRCADC